MQISSRNLQFVVIALLFVILFTIVTKDFSNGSARAVLTSNESTKYQQTNTIVSPNVVPKDDLVSCKNALLNFKNDLNDLPEEIKASLASLVAKQEQESNKNIVSESRAGAKWNPNLEHCQGQGLTYAPANKEGKVSKENAIKLVRGDWNKIPQGSGVVDFVGLVCMKLSKIQHGAGIYGSVGEMGVHYGRFTSTLFITARKTEKLVVADVFGQQEKNIDGSGNGNYDGFMDSLEVYGLNGRGAESDIHTIHIGSTDELKNNWSEEAGFEFFRMISVDAGHTASLTRNDLLISSCNLLKGGIVILDDLFHPGWVGVTEGLFNFFDTMLEPLQLYPFLACENKLFMTNSLDYHGKYYEMLLSDEHLKSNLWKNGTHIGASNEFILHGVQFLQCDRGALDIAEIWASSVY